MIKFNSLIALGTSAALWAGCQTAVRPAKPPAEEARTIFAPMLAAGKKLVAAQNARHGEGKEVRTGKEAANLANAYVAAIHDFYTAAVTLAQFTPALERLTENSPDLKAFRAEMQRLGVRPVPEEFAAWIAFLDRFSTDKEVLFARSNLLAAEQLLLQWAEGADPK